MSMPTSDTHSLMYASAQSISIATASATSSTAFPAGTVAVRLVSACTGYYNTAGSASATGGAYLPANTIVFAEADSASRVSFLCLATATPQVLHVVPCGS